MDKSFISYSAALALKELGFTDDCFAVYTDSGTLNHNPMSPTLPGTVRAPLHQQAFDFFRNFPFLLHGSIVPYRLWGPDKDRVGYTITIISEMHERDEVDHHSLSYEAARDTCLGMMISRMTRGRVSLDEELLTDAARAARGVAKADAHPPIAFKR